MTEAELDEIPARHFPRELYPEMCNGCHESWPCEQSRLASEVTRLRGELRVAEARIAGAKALLTPLPPLSPL